MTSARTLDDFYCPTESVFDPLNKSPSFEQSQALVLAELMLDRQLAICTFANHCLKFGAFARQLLCLNERLLYLLYPSTQPVLITVFVEKFYIRMQLQPVKRSPSLF
jgi:hypothetical protein